MNLYGAYFVPKVTDPFGLKPTDKTFGIDDDDFWDWWHGYKADMGGIPDIQSRAEADRYYQQFNNDEKRPRGKGGKSGHGGRSKCNDGGGKRGRGGSGRIIGPCVFVATILLDGDIGMACDPLGPGILSDPDYRPPQRAKRCYCAEFSYTMIVPSFWAVWESTETSKSVQRTLWKDYGMMDPLDCGDMQRTVSTTSESVVGFTIYNVTKLRCQSI